MEQQKKKTKKAPRKNPVNLRDLNHSANLNTVRKGKNNHPVTGDKNLMHMELTRCRKELRVTRKTLEQASKQLKLKEKNQKTRIELLEEIVECAEGPVFSIDKNYCYTSYNKSHKNIMKELYGAKIEIGKSILDYHTNPIDRAQAKKNINLAMKGETVIVRSFAGDDARSRRFFEIGHYPINGPDKMVRGVTVFARDITELKSKEEENNRIARTLKTLSNSNQAMMRAKNEAEFMEEVCRNIENDCGYAMVWIGLAEKDPNKSVRPIISAGFEDGYLENARISWGDNERGRGPTGTAIRTGKVGICRNMLTDPKFAPWRDEAIRHGYASSIALPLISGARPFGAITIYSQLPDAFSKDEVKILSELASDLAYGITAFKLRAEQERAEEALKDSEENYRLLLKFAPTAIYELDYNGPRFKSVNDAMCQMSGYSREELLAMGPMALLDEESRKLFQERIRKIVTGEKVDENVEYGVIVKGGEKVWANLNINLTYKDGKNVGALVVAHNVTERRRMEEALRNANRLLETVTEGTKLIISTIDTNYRYTYFNQAYKEEIIRLIGKEIQIGTSMVEIFADSLEQQKVAIKEWNQTLNGMQQNSNVEFGDPNRYRRIYSVRRAPIRDTGGTIIGAGEVATDITEQEDVKKALAETETRYQSLFNEMTEGFALHEIIYDENNIPCDYRFLDMNPAFEKLTGLRREKIIGKLHNDVLPDDSPVWVEIFGKVALTGEPIQFENYSPALKRYYSVNSFRPEPGKFAVIFQDIGSRKESERALRQARDELETRVQDRTKELVEANEQLEGEIRERKRAEAASQESEGRYGTLFETSPDAIILIDLHNKIVSANQQAAALHGYSDPPHLKGLSIGELILPKEKKRVIQKIRSTRESGYLKDIEYQIQMKNGSLVPVELNASVVRNEADQIIGFLLDIRDITEQNYTEESLRSAYAYNRSLIDASLDPLMTITPDGKIGDANKAAELVTGCSRAELVGTDFHNYFVDTEKARAGYQMVFENGTVRDYNLEIRNKNGNLTPVLFNAAVYYDEAGIARGVFAAARDITERRQFETQLVQAEKHAVIGRMVGSITHEINNPLQTIKNCLYLMQQDITPESSLQEPLEMAASETLRLTNLVGHLRELYRPKAGINKQSNEVLDIIEEVHSLLIPHLNSAGVDWQPLKGLQRSYIDCVRDQILEVFLNISMNAIEAMQKKGGTLFIDMVKTDDRTAILFKDTGPGLPEEIAKHIFEPFMTTKASGLGLGLSISYGIIQRHGGQILVENQPGQGATFTVLLPNTSQTSNLEVPEHGDR